MREQQHNPHQDISRMSLPTPTAAVHVPPSPPVSQISRSQSFPFPPDYHHKRPREQFGPPTVGLPNQQFPPIPHRPAASTTHHLSLHQLPPPAPVQPPTAAVQNGTPTKKKRSNNYVAPKKIPLTFNSQVAAGGLRRQLSSSKIETFLSSGDDGMDVEVEASRPRSMSL